LTEVQRQIHKRTRHSMPCITPHHERMEHLQHTAALLLKGQMIILHEKRPRKRRDRRTIVIKTQRRRFFHSHVSARTTTSERIAPTPCEKPTVGFVGAENYLHLRNQKVHCRRHNSPPLGQPIYSKFVFLETFEESRKASISFVISLLSVCIPSRRRHKIRHKIILVQQSTCLYC